MTYKHSFISTTIFSLLGLIAGFILFKRATHHDMPEVSLLPDAYLENVVATFMDKQGKPSLKIITPKMIHYENHDISHFNTPELTIYRKSSQPWFISARFAKASQGLEQIDFIDNVSIHHAADLTSPATVINTVTLTVKPNTETAETQSIITMMQPNIIIQATGMSADINSGNIKLFSAAKGEYVPNS